MLEKIKANILFNKLLQRPDIEKAYAMVDKSDSWYDTITKVHNSLNEIQKLPHETIEIKSHDNLILRGIYYPGDSSKNVTVITSHGYTSHAEREWAFPGLFYHMLGFNVIIPYHRAHGLSEGKYITFGALEHLDMMAWIKKANELNPSTKIILHGLSMGGGIVLDLCDKELPGVKCIIADAPSMSIEAFFKNVSNAVFKEEGNKISELVIKKFQKKFKANPTDFESINFIKNSQYPILLAAGSNENKEDLFKTIKTINPCDTEIIILPGCNHGNGMYKATELFQSTIINFINKYIN